MLLCAGLLMVGCQTAANVNDCRAHRKPPDMKPETRSAIFKDKPVLTWMVAVNMDGQARGCW